MHYLHCILTTVEDGTPEEMKEEAKMQALEETVDYHGQVFDWREDNAGRWKERLSHDDVVLGKTDPDLFFQLLEEWRRKPLESAIELIELHERKANQFKEIKLDKESLEEIWQNDASWLPARVFALISGQYMTGSHFYSIPDGEARLSKRTYKKIKQNPEQFALVFLDYHF